MCCIPYCLIDPHLNLLPLCCPHKTAAKSMMTAQNPLNFAWSFLRDNSGLALLPLLLAAAAAATAFPHPLPYAAAAAVVFQAPIQHKHRHHASSALLVFLQLGGDCIALLLAIWQDHLLLLIYRGHLLLLLTGALLLLLRLLLLLLT
jgi:hypothetical protein